MEIIELAPASWREYKELRLEALRKEPRAYFTTYKDSLQQPDGYWQARLEAVSEGKGSWLLFAREGGRLVGIIGAYTDAGVTEIVSLYVTSHARRRGLGRALMNAILKKITGFNPDQVIRLTVNASQRAAVELYRSLGFKTASRQNALMGDGRRYDTWVMEKIL